MEVRPGYKQTEVGVIPEEWEVHCLAEIADIRSGGTPSTAEPRFWDGDVPWCTPTDITALAGRKYLSQTARRISEAGLLASSAEVIRAISVIMTSRATIGECAINLVPMATNQGFKNLVTKDGTDTEFLYYCMTTQKKRLIALSGGSTFLEIGKGELSGFEVAIPCALDEQRAIATALSDVDALLEGLDRLIAKKRDLKQAAMQQLLTGQTRLKGFGPTKSFKQYDYGIIPDDWSVRLFKNASSMNGRIGWQGLKQDEFTENPDDPFLITGMNFQDGRIRWGEVYHIPTKRYQEAPNIQLQVGDVLVTKDGTIGKLLFVDHIPYPGKASLNSHLLVFRPLNQQYDPKFLFYQLGSPAFARHIELYKSGSTFFGLTQAATGKYPVVLPPLLEQTSIAAALSDMDAELAALEARRDKTYNLKQAMIQELLTGKTRLVPAGASHA